jgi:hypothetical protein
MKALVYHGPGNKTWEEKPKPKILQPSDAVVRISKTTICGTDLHILKGDVPEVVDGRILGHEGVGVIGKPGHRLLISKRVIMYLSPVFLPVVNVIIVNEVCIRIAKMEDGSSVTLLMEHRQNMRAFLLPTIVSIIFPLEVTRKHW